uniref:GRIP domain-containing protein n=1 Tax=Plectus sambesii TaxID=2011161 RepID=A0A914WYL4_9BILA
MASPQQALHLNGDDGGEEENREVSPIDGATPSRIPVPNRMPKKGILKRSTSFGSRRDNESGDTIFPLRVDRHSAERDSAPPSSKPSRIPKLSVTWWETNSVCGDSPEPRRRDGRTRSVEEEEPEGGGDDDEEESVGSSAGSSQIAGTWWFGRSTRYVPHCERRGHHHHHGEGGECGEYLTPTQRKNRELIELKKQLRTALAQIDDKERHLAQLRERLNELENMMDSNTALSETHRLMTRQKELTAQFEAEKRALTDKYEQRVRQLRQDATDARAETVKAVQLAEQRAVPERPATADAAVMTQQFTADDAAAIIQSGDLERTVDMYQQECHALRMRIAELEAVVERQNRGTLSIAEQQQQLQQQNSHLCLGAQCVAQRQELFAQLQAHQNEALAWRTKAAELEIIVKQRLMTNDPVLLRIMNGSMSPTPADATDAERYRQECLRLQGYINQLEMERGNREMVDSGIEAHSGQSAQTLLGDCIMAQCVSKRRQLSDDNCQLTERLADAQLRLSELEDELMDTRRADAEMDTNLKRLEKRVADVLQQLQSKMAECEAAQLGVQRCQTDNATLRKAVDYLEERNQLLQNTLLDAGLIVHGESTANWRKGFSNPRSRVDQSKKTQTELTSESLGNHEKDFLSLAEKMGQLEKEYSSERTDLRGRFREIQENLALKAELVQTLTKQLQASSAQLEAEAESAERERQEYSRRLNDLALIAQRVPLLEAEVERAQEERLTAERTVHVEREKYQEALETSLSGSLKQQQDHSQYWQQKLAVVQRQHEADKIELKKLQKQYNEIKLRLNMEKVDLEQKLEGTIQEVATLTDKVYRPMEHKEVMAKPDVVNKYVACRPILKHKSSEIVKGDLFDETEERLKLCQGELLTTRRQVEVLQQKLLECVQVKEQHREEGAQLKKAHALEADLKEDRRKSEETLKNLRDTNAQLEARLRHIEEEKSAIVWAERDKIAHLAAEFDNVRQELDTEIRKYEAEKRRMKDKVTKLELAVKDRDQLKARLKRFEGYDQLLADGPQPLDMRAIENELEMIKQSAQIVVVEPPPEEDAATPPVPKKMSATSTSRDPCVQFLLARLQSERQKYTEDTDFLRRKMADASGERDRLLAAQQNGDVRRTSTKPLERTCSDPLLASVTVGQGGDDTKAQLRAKNLLLIKDNRKLATELADVRRTVASSINRTASRRSTVGSLDVQSQAPSSIRSERSPGFADLASDLNEVRVDLEGILQQIDNATIHQTTAQFAVATSEKARDGRLMQWLEKELEEDKRELDVMTKWYDQDKRRMETDLKLSREDRAALQAQLDRLAVDYHDVCRELELYKQEDANRGRVFVSTNSANPSTAPFDGRLVRSRSSTDIAGGFVDREEHVRWKHKAGTMFRELGRLRRDHKTVDADLRNAQQQIIILRGELELARAGLVEPTNASSHDVSFASAALSISENSLDDNPANMTPRERDLVLRLERTTSHNRALETETDRLRDEIRRSAAEHEMTKGDLHAAQVQMRALEAQLTAQTLQQRPLPKPANGENTLQVVWRQKRRSETGSDTTIDSDVMHCSSGATFATARMPSCLSLAKTGRLAQSDPDIAFRTASSPNLASSGSPNLVTAPSSIRPSITERLVFAEERANRCEQEFDMAQTELLLLRDATQRQLSALRAERNELKKRLHEAVCDAEKMGGPSGWDRVEELNAEIDDLRAEVDRMTNERQDMYLIMFKKGQDAAKHEMEIVADRNNRRDSTPSYTGPLKTEHLDEQIGQRQGLTEDEVVLRFLRDAVYYFLLNRDSKDHLQAIMSILKFSGKQREDVYRKRGGIH